VDIDTPHGPARAHVQAAENAVATLVLGHGAGGGVSAPDLMVTTRAALERQVSVALVEQPYLVAGRKSQAPAAQLDAAWIAAVERLRDDDLPLIVGGRSAGARVACRTAATTGASAVLCLAFPVHPPGKPEKSRLDELDAVKLPVLVVQGERDPFGMPPSAPNRTVVKVAGDHGLKADLEAVATGVRDWLSRL
jgi:predicted alpha/beta-hydrolase family hydrolase